jgi:plastocyanin
MRYRLALLVALLPVVGACSNGRESATSTTAATTPISRAVTTVATTVATATPTTAASVPATANDATVGIADFKFTPAEVHVPVGGSVVWTNNDTQPHTATSAGSFDAGTIQPQKSATVAFPAAGTFTYICSFHPFMNGVVVVG